MKLKPLGAQIERMDPCIVAWYGGVLFNELYVRVVYSFQFMLWIRTDKNNGLLLHKQFNYNGIVNMDTRAGGIYVDVSWVGT